MGLLADYPHLVAEVGLMRWREWGRAPEPADPAFWVSVTGEEAGRISLPVSWVAVDADGQAVGAVGLGKFDIDERRDRTPWVLGMIVRPDRRRGGIGRLLLDTLGDWARSRGVLHVWVASGGLADPLLQRVRVGHGSRASLGSRVRRRLCSVGTSRTWRWSGGQGAD